MKRAAWLGLLMIACDGGPPSTDGTLEPTTLGDDDDSTVPTKVNDDEGSLVVLQWLPHRGSPDPSTVASGMFVETRRGWINLAQCLASPESYCTQQLPQSYGDVVTVEKFDDDLLADLVSRNVGEQIQIGPWKVDRFDLPGSSLEYYLRSWAAADPATDPLDIQIHGDWGENELLAALEPPTPFVLTSHDPGVLHDFYSSEPLALRWEPGTEGEVYLFVRTKNAQYLQKVEDTGELDLGLLQFNLDPGDKVDMYLGRWSVADLSVDGHDLNVQVQVNQWLHGVYKNTGAREELPPYLVYDTCAEAIGQPPLQPGSYYGTIAKYGKDYDPQGSPRCTGWPAAGPDAILPIHLEPHELLTATYSQVGDDGAIYLLEDCGVEETCITGSDGASPFGGVESFGYYNDSSVAEDLWLVLDAYGPVNDVFHLDLTIEPTLDDPLQSSCVDAINQGPLTSGSYQGTMAAYPDRINVDDSPYFSDYADPECAAAKGTPGGDGKAMIELLNGEQLTVHATVPGGNPKLFLLYTCNLVDSCRVYDDTQKGEEETLVYQNTSGFSETLYIVLDGATETDNYFLDIEVQ